MRVFNRFLWIFLHAFAFAAASQAQPLPTLDWEDRYSGAGNDNDTGLAIARHLDGTVVASRIFEPTGPNTLEPRILLVRYRADGSRAWEQVVAGLSASPVALAVDATGAVFVAADVNFPAGLGLIKHEADGTFAWQRVTFPNPLERYRTKDLVLDSTGAPRVLGTELAFSNDTSMIVAAFDTDGDPSWVFRHTGALGASSEALTIGDGDELYVTGTIAVANLASEVGLVKVSSTGSYVWDRTYGSPGPFTQDFGRAVAVRPDGVVIVTGLVGANTVEGTDVAVLAFDAAGQLVWDYVYDGPDAASDGPDALALAADGAVVVVGYSERSAGDLDGLVLVVDDGVPRWSRLWSGAAGARDWFHDVALGPAGRVFAVGEAIRDSAGSAYLTAAYEADGTLRWEHFYPGPLGGLSIARAVATDAAGGIVVTGGSWDQGADGIDEDVATIRLLESIFADGFESGDTSAWSLAVP